MRNPKNIIVIDVEATCWPSPTNQRSEIIEVGVTPIDLATYTLGVSESILVIPPTTEISDFCTDLTTLTPAMVRDWGISFPDAMTRLQQTYHLRQNIFASWGDYDRKILTENCQWHQIPNPLNNLLLNVKALFAAKYGVTGGVQECMSRVGLNFIGTPHRGLDDSRMIAKLLLHLLGHNKEIQS